MEYCANATLETYLITRNMKPGFQFVTKNQEGEESGVFDRHANLRIFTHIVNGLLEIHRSNIVHRDLKPENIFIMEGKDGLPTAKIGDFGLSRTLTNQTEEDNLSSVPSTHGGSTVISNRFSSIAGTKAYMAPEILELFNDNVQPEDYEIDKSQDIYSLGLILYELCHKIKTNM
jgi:translation initiation factor 2-alpha kinase 4